MSRTAWFNCGLAGVSGDMALGSLVDAGADTSELFRLLERLPVGGWGLDFEISMRNGLSATRAIVSAQDDAVVRTFMHVVAIVEEARLPPRVRDRALAAFRALARTESRLHQRPPERVTFHEVGGHDAIIDIVGTSAALELLEVDSVSASEIATGYGVVRSAHGLLPVPSPAVASLLVGVPVVSRDVQAELTTPTGAAMMVAWASRFGDIPDMTITAVGFGAGGRQLDGIPNCTQVVLGAPRSAGDRWASGRPLVQLEANIDDATGETLASAVASLMQAGALDAWVTPIVMKKGRPAHSVSVLCDPSLARDLTLLLHETTGTLGVRTLRVERWAASREMDEVEILGHLVRVKVSKGRVKAEHGDVERVASATGLSLLEVAAQAETSFRRSREEKRSALTALHPSSTVEDPDEDGAAEPARLVQLAPLREDASISPIGSGPLSTDKPPRGAREPRGEDVNPEPPGA